MSETFLTAFFRSQFLTRWFILLSHLVDQRLHFLLVFGFIAFLKKLADEFKVVFEVPIVGLSGQPFLVFRKSGLRRVDRSFRVFGLKRAAEQEIASPERIFSAFGQR